VNWDAIAIVANAVVAVAYFGISGAIAIPLIGSGQVRRNQLGVATAAIFFTCAVGHGLHGVNVIEGDGGHGAGILWHTAAWDGVTALIACYYWTLRRTYAPLLRGASLFEDLKEQQRVERLEAAQAVLEARQDVERVRDEHAALLRAVIDNAQPLIYVKDLDGRYLLANEAFQRSFGLDEHAVLGRTDHETAPAEASMRREHDLRSVHGAFRVEEQALTTEGVRIFDSARFPVVDSQGTVRGTGAVSLDVTAARQAATELALARDAALAATAAKSAFLATMSHEIRTPMNAVIGTTALLLDTSLDEHQRDLVQTARSSSDALLDLINDILDFSKIEAGELRIEAHPFDVLDAVDSVMDLVATAAAQKGLAVTARVKRSCPSCVVGDVTRLRQVLLNLISNAIKFTSAGSVSLRIWTEPDDGDLVRLWAEVTDTGIGISEEGAGRLFSAFSQVDDSMTRRFGGTGLGLAISRRLVEAMDGQIGVRSELGSGSCFTFSVRLRRADVEADVLPASLSGSTVLLVMETGVVRQVLAAQLADWDLQCREADSVEDALALQADGARWDVAVIEQGAAARSASTAALTGVDATQILLTEPVGVASAIDREQFPVAIAQPVRLGALRAALMRAFGLSDPAPVVPEQRSGEKLPLRILLAEDNPVNQKVGRLLLRNLGYFDIDIAADGREAVAAAQNRRYDLILMDLQMPLMDGLEATRRIRQLPQGVAPRIVALTAAASASDREDCAAAGMDGYLTKPIRESALREVLTNAPANTPANAPVAAPASAPLDAQALELLLDQVGARTAVELVEEFLADAAIKVERLATTIDSGAVGDVGRLAHDLRSTAALFGASTLAALLSAIEAAGREESLPDVSADSVRPSSCGRRAT
jgi:two-component system, sensor histidine kinase and response regulator